VGERGLLRHPLYFVWPWTQAAGSGGVWPALKHGLRNRPRSGVGGERWLARLYGGEPGEALGMNLAIVYSVSIVAIMASLILGVCFEFPVPA